MLRQILSRPRDIRRWELRTLVAIPILFIATALTTSVLGVELTLRALSPLSLSPAQSLALERVRLGLFGLGSLGALGLGLLLGLAIALPLRRMIEMVKARIEPGSPVPPKAAVNELAELSNVFDHMLLSFDKFVTDSQILEGIPEGVLVVNGQGRIKRTNAEARRLLESAGATLEGRELAQVFGREVGQTLAHAVRQVRKTEATVQLPPIPVTEPGGTGPELSVTLTPFPFGGSGEALLTVKDLSQVPKIRGEIRRVDQLAAVGAHVASLAHEVSGGLMAIQTLLDLLPAQADEESRIKEKLQAELDRATRLMDEIRAFGQVTLRERTTCKVGELVEETLWLVQTRFLAKEIEVSTQLPSDSPWVMGDRDRLTQAFMNILANAFEATPPGGTIRVTVERDGGDVVIRVANTGSYIPPEEEKKIFTLFYTTKKSGTGLGLPLARRTVKDHGGGIEVNSSSDAGTEFVIRLPAGGMA